MANNLLPNTAFAKFGKLFVRESMKELARLSKEIDVSDKERMNTFLWLMDETVERERPETVTFRRPKPFSTETT